MEKAAKPEVNIAKLRAAIDYEQKHLYINAEGKSGSFAKFFKKEVTKALRIYKHSSRWATIKVLIDRYEFVDVSTRINLIKQVVDTLDEIEDVDLHSGFREKPGAQFGSSPFVSKSAQKETVNKIANRNGSNTIEPLPRDPDLDISEVDIRFLKGVGPKLAEKLSKLGIETVEDLLNYLPRKHISYKDKILIKDLVLEDDVTVFGQIYKINSFQSKRGLVIISIIIRDPSGKVKVNKYLKGESKHFLEKQIRAQYPIGAHVLCAGKVKAEKYSRVYRIDSPMLEIVSDDFTEGEDNIHTARIVPIYPLSEGVSLIQLRKVIYNALTLYKNNLNEFIPQGILDKHELIDYQTSLEQIHFPDSLDEKDKASERLIFNEFFLMQLRFAQRRNQVKHMKQGIEFNCFDNGLVDTFLDNLEFELTFAQQRVFYQEILPDLVNKSPMHRLLQGDVGSGKTVVAFLTLLVAIDNGFQGALMVPTEVLAEQHFKKFLDYSMRINSSENKHTKVALLTGKMKAAEKRETLQGLANGQINIVVGTHALIQEKVDFSNLGLVIIDEQHRFGVKQRDALVKKAKDSTVKNGDGKSSDKDSAIDNDSIGVERLFMTATPIPRTLALSTHGDLDVSEIDEMPKGRVPIITELVKKKADGYKRIRDEIQKGNQAYVVFPLIDESEALSAKAATVEYNKLKEEIFSDFSDRIGLMHGKLKPDEKDEVMEKFRNKELYILVATTVIEVGVDVPDATVMFIESAERFGLAQLHQLRGRVGRSDKQSYCLLASNSQTETNKIRLGILTKTNNGFIVAQEDMKLRGAGDFMGTRQSGLPDFALANLADHEDMLFMARNSANELISKDAELIGHTHQGLKKRLARSSYQNTFVGG